MTNNKLVGGDIPIDASSSYVKNYRPNDWFAPCVTTLMMEAWGNPSSTAKYLKLSTHADDLNDSFMINNMIHRLTITIK